MLGDDRGGRRLVPTQSISRVGVWDRLHLGSVALELRRTRRRTKLVLSLPVSMLKAQRNIAREECRAAWGRGPNSLARARARALSHPLIIIRAIIATARTAPQSPNSM